MSAAAEWDAWLAESLGKLQVDSDVYAPYVTGILEDDSLSSDEQAASVMDLLTDAAPAGAVQAATVDSFTQRWQERRRQQTLEAAAAGEAVLRQYAAAKAAQRAADEQAAAARSAHLSEAEQMEKRRLVAQLESESSGEDDGGLAADFDDDDAKAKGAYQAELRKAREEERYRAEQRREAISRAAEREVKQKAEHDARRALREQAGHIKGGTPTKGAGGRSQRGGRGGGAAP